MAREKVKKSSLIANLLQKPNRVCKFNLYLKIKIGDDVHLDAYGLKTNLNGLLSVKQDKGKLGLFGQINLKKVVMLLSDRIY